MELHFDIVDVFTDRPFAGNPLAIVHRARTLTARQMQALAAEFGFSETAFTLPPTSSRATYRLRIFTPTRELPFAGHPSIGAAWALGFADVIRIGDVVQECGAGLLPLEVDRDGARLVGGTPVVGPDRDGAQLAGTVGLTVDDLDPALPPGVASAGVPFAFLAVTPEAVACAVPDPGAVARATAELTGLAVVAVDREKGTAHLRMFGPQVGVTEDPATGSAAVALGVHLAARGALPEGRSVVSIAQGAELGRPSALTLQVDVAGGAAVEVAVRGGVRMVARGELLALPEP